MTDRPSLSPHPGLDRLIDSRSADDQRMREALARYTCCGTPNLCGASRQDDEQSALLAWANRELDAQRDRYADLLATLWLYVNWRHVTRQLTTEQKRLFADAVDASSDGPVAERWWDWPSCAVCTQPVEERDGRWFDLRGMPGQAEPVNWAGVGLTLPHAHTVEATP